MGSPIYGLLAELKLQPLEKLIISTSTLKPALSVRYVDDTLVIHNNDISALNEFMTHGNCMDSKIQFTCEIDGNALSPFLHKELIKHISAHSIDRKNYRKLCRFNKTIS